MAEVEPLRTLGGLDELAQALSGAPCRDGNCVNVAGATLLCL